MDEVFKALADPHRRRLLDRLNTRNGQTLTELCADLDMSRQAVSKHLAVLEAARLVTTFRRGREKLHYLNAVPINEIADRWIHHYERARVTALADPEQALETTTMDKPEFVSTTYIRTTPERLWAALTEPAFTRRSWNTTTIESDWKAGSTMAWGHGDLTVRDPEQVVLESDPPRRLSYTWYTFSEEWARAWNIDEELRVRIAAERRSRVTFDLEPDGPLVKLTVVHDDFDPGSKVAEMVSGGWPRVIGGLKTLLEAGGTDDDGFAAQIVVNSSVDEVFAALTTLDGLASWWTQDVSGSPDAPGGELTFGFETEKIRMRVEHVEPTLVVWTCLGSERFDEWQGTSVWFDVRSRDAGSVTIRFRHVGLFSTCDCYGTCSGGWQHYLQSIRSFVEGRGGAPYRSPEWAARPR